MEPSRSPARPDDRTTGRADRGRCHAAKRGSSPLPATRHPTNLLDRLLLNGYSVRAMETPSDLQTKLWSLALNLWWTWHPEVTSLFRDLDPELWEVTHHNPVAFLKAVDSQNLEERARAHNLSSRILAAARRLESYLRSDNTWCARRAGMLKARPIAYFSAEFGLHEALPLYSGGLGVLAGDHLKSASDLDLPIVGVGLLYARGYFTQRIDEDGWQSEEFGRTDITSLPLERVSDTDGRPVLVEIRSGSDIIRAGIWKARVGRCQLVLLDTDVEGNSPDQRQITQRLYWGDQSTRILQEIVLGVGGLQALRHLGIRPGVYHLNEGHSAFALLEATRMEMEENGCSFGEASHRIGTRSVFTTHTPVPAGHDRFPVAMVTEHLGWMRDALGIDEATFLALGREDATDTERFCMTALALRLAHRANGVAAVHGDVSRRMWAKLWPEREVSAIPIGHVTNGVHTRSWMAPQLERALERHLGADWTRRTSHRDLWQHMDKVSAAEIWDNHRLLKADLINFVRGRFTRQEERRGTASDEAASRASDLLDPEALTLGFARRFATYKRAALIFRDHERLSRLFSDTDRPLQIVFAGKAHPRDDGGKALIQEIFRITKSDPFRGRIVFIEDYDINVARHLVQGVDVWVNNPVRPEEACGTSGMKAALNGVLNLSVLDGWWAEAYDGKNGFVIDSPGPHGDPEIQDARDHDALLSALENEVIPLFFDRDESGMPAAWIERVRWAFMTLAWRYSADRMVMDYARTRYLPAAMGNSCE